MESDTPFGKYLFINTKKSQNKKHSTQFASCLGNSGTLEKLNCRSTHLHTTLCTIKKPKYIHTYITGIEPLFIEMNVSGLQLSLRQGYCEGSVDRNVQFNKNCLNFRFYFFIINIIQPKNLLSKDILLYIKYVLLA